MGKHNVTLEAQHLYLRYDSRTIIRDVSFTLHPGELTALIGPNGAGKSSLLRLIACLESADGGQVDLGGIGPLHTLSATARAHYVGWVGDHGHLPFAFTAFETVRLGRYPWHRGTPSHVDDEAAIKALKSLEIDHLADREVTSMSSGERQKIMLARLMAGDTPILLLDEPLANLDIGSSLKLLGLLRDMTRKGATICITIHDLSLAYRFADRIICLEQGQIRADGWATEVLTSAEVARVFSIKTAIAPGLQLTPDEVTGDDYLLRR